MPDENSAKTYCLISDLYFGGDGQLQVCDCRVEMVAFLKMLEKEMNPSELIIVGDAFGFWEMTTAYLMSFR